MVTSAPAGVVPAPRTPLIGRDEDLAMLHGLIVNGDERVLTLTGVGGCGKTCLATHLATDLAQTFPERVWFVELAALADPALLPLAVAAALGVQDSAESADVHALSRALNTQPALLVLDNCEHLIDACAAFVDRLLVTGPWLRVLVTSREPLQIPGERQYRVTPLALPAPDYPLSVDTLAATPAVQLFLARAQAVAPDIRLTGDNAALVADICRRLDGIPLAIELAAARVRVLSLEQILARLDDSFRVLVGGSRVAPTRQQTLRATLDWGDALLAEDERALFHRLAVFAGPFRLDAVELICADDTLPTEAILELLTRLVDKSLVTVTQDDRNVWYRLLEPVRQYALQGLTASGELATARARHASGYVTIVEQDAPGLYGPVQDSWLRRLERVHGNLRAALSWALDEREWAIGLRLATALVPFWEAHGHLAEGRRWLEAALAAPDDAVEPMLRMQALVGAGRLSHLHAAYAEAERLHAESLAIGRNLDDRHGIATALTELGMVKRRLHELDGSIESIESGLALFRDLGDEAGIAVALLNLGSSVGEGGDVPRAVAIVSDSLARYETLGDLRHASIAHSIVGRLLQMDGDVEAATRSVAASLAGHARLEDRWFVVYNLMTLMRIQMKLGHWESVAHLLGAAQAIGEGVSRTISDSAYEDFEATVRAHMSAERFTSAWSTGNALSFAQAVAAALEIATPAVPAPDQEQPPAALRDAMPLTRREREVAALLAHGLTDRQIADKLFISTGTVGVHVHNILGKLGLHSRVQVAGWLAEQSPSDRETS